MIIANAQYIKAPLDNPDNENTDIKATIDGTVRWVPMTVGNRHYAEILRQVEAGELTIADAD
jgi:hypothetical protein